MQKSHARQRVIVLSGGVAGPLAGGIGSFLLYLQQAWAARADGPVVTVIDTPGGGGWVWGALRFLRALGVLVWVGRPFRGVVVHAHVSTRGSVVRKAILCGVARRLGMGVVMHMHGADFASFYRRLRRGHRAALGRALGRADRVIVLGQAWRDLLVEEIGVAGWRVVVIPNGVPAPVREQGAKVLGGAVKLLFLGRLGERKGVPDLLTALGSSALRGLNWTATIAGDGDLRGAAGLVQAHGLEGQVDLPGWIDRAQAAALLAEADILVLPSRDEAMPMAVLEALAAGVAVVATPVGAIPDILEDGVNALLVPPRMPARLAAALARLILDEGLRRRLGESGHAAFCARFDIRVVARRVETVFEEVCRQTKQGLLF